MVEGLIWNKRESWIERRWRVTIGVSKEKDDHLSSFSIFLHILTKICHDF